ncbi:hypothetical protein DVH24_010269 [Malus domestica]|uniref:F-box domain-containing protein n=1 Tax=Malus domestica TaxID=3750 RepID=A0A498JVZ8_MALDO|nr:hypothetical protein DVH24_010269 [Malus domestica]
MQALNEYEGAEGEVNYGLDNNQNCQLTKLRIVKITGIYGDKAELDFIRFLLSSSPVLEKMTVKPATARDFQLVKMLLQFKHFIILLLSSSPVLEKMIVEPAAIVRGFPELLKKVLPYVLVCLGECRDNIHGPLMEREPPKSRLKVSMELDRISNLPSDFINKILSYLPIKEAVRTSVLSSKWRNKSAMLAHLLFDDRCTSDQNPTTFAGIVDHVLLGHIGPIYRVAITHFQPQVGRDIDRWILHLSRNSIKELWLSISCGGHRYKMPSCFFSCQDLILLVLHNCFLQPPSTFQGFRRVKNCGLFNVALDQDVFENLIVCCPLLERLMLAHCDGLTQFKIDAPNLKFLKFEGVLEDVSFVNTLKLADVHVCLTANVANDQRQTAGSCSNLVKFFVHLPRIRCLHVTNYFLKYLAVGVLPGRLPQPYFNDRKEILTVLCLLRSFPALRDLEILARKKDQAVVGDVNYGLDNNQNCHLTKLRIVKITGISGVKAELDFIRLLLSSSPVLEKMIVKPATTNDFQLVNKLLQKLLQFKRVSENAKIFYVDP